MKRLCMMVLAILAMGTHAQDAWVVERLKSLTPDDPTGYFLLAEEVVGEPEPSESDVELARRLLVLSFELSEAGTSTSLPVRGAACLALASLEPSDARRRWLRALAERVDARYQAPAWRQHAAAADALGARAMLAEAVGEVRAGRGRFAIETMEEPEIARVLEQTGPILNGFGGGASVERLLALARAYDTPECGGRRAIPEGGPARRRFILCPENEGNPGPQLTTAEYLAYLRFEALLLEAEPDSWAAELTGGGRAPLRDPEPDELAPLFGVDPSRSLWRDGGWVRPPDA